MCGCMMMDAEKGRKQTCGVDAKHLFPPSCVDFAIIIIAHVVYADEGVCGYCHHNRSRQTDREQFIKATKDCCCIVTTKKLVPSCPILLCTAADAPMMLDLRRLGSSSSMPLPNTLYRFLLVSHAPTTAQSTILGFRL